jgi:hypothetical protein
MANDKSNRGRERSDVSSSGPQKAITTMKTERNMKNVGIHGTSFGEKTGKD